MRRRCARPQRVLFGLETVRYNWSTEQITVKGGSVYANVRDTTLYFDVDGAGLVDDDRHGTREKPVLFAD
jgi:hypothetical protein